MVFSSTLESVDWNSRIVRGDPIRALAHLKKEFPGDLSVGGATLAGAFIRAGLVDEIRFVVHPVAIGSGTRALPPLDRPLDLELVETQRFGSGVIVLVYHRSREAR